MKLELRKVRVLRAANVCALLYGLLMTAFALVAAPLFFLAALVAPSSEFGGAEPLFPFILLLIYPVLGLAMGWISGLLSSASYNLIVRWTGGIIFEFDGGAVALGNDHVA